MKVKLLFFLSILIIGLSVSCKNQNSNKTSNSIETYSKPERTCKPSTSKVRRLVRANWKSIQRKADFTVSNKGSFEIRNYGMDGDDLVVDIYSRGYMYDISFTVSFDAYFDDDCTLEGDVLDCYNYRKH